MENNKVINDYFDNVNITHFRMIVLVGIAYFFDIIDNYNFSFISPILAKYWNISLTQIGQINSIFFLGMFFGGLFGGTISDIFGRKKAFLISIFLFSIFSIFSGISPNVQIFMIGRFFTGIGVSSLVIVSTPYLLEMLPKDNRGRWQAISVGTGCIAIPLLGICIKLIVPLGSQSWRIVYLIGGLGLIVTLLGIRWLKESPRWLVSQGKVKEAEMIVEEITGKKTDLSLIGNSNLEKLSVGKAAKEIFKKKHIKNTLVLISIFAISYPAGFIFINWVPILYSTKGYSIQETSSLNLFISFGMTLGPFFASLISDRFGRKISIIFIAVSSAVLAFIYGNLDNNILIILVAVILAILIQGNSPITLAYLGELYPTNIRSIASGIIYSIGRITIALVSSIVPIINLKFAYLGVFVLMGILMAITAITTIIWGEQTSGKSLEEVNS